MTKNRWITFGLVIVSNFLSFFLLSPVAQSMENNERIVFEGIDFDAEEDLFTGIEFASTDEEKHPNDTKTSGISEVRSTIAMMRDRQRISPKMEQTLVSKLDDYLKTKKLETYLSVLEGLLTPDISMVDIGYYANVASKAMTEVYPEVRKRINIETNSIPSISIVMSFLRILDKEMTHLKHTRCRPELVVVLLDAINYLRHKTVTKQKTGTDLLKAAKISDKEGFLNALEEYVVPKIKTLSGREHYQIAVNPWRMERAFAVFERAYLSDLGRIEKQVHRRPDLPLPPVPQGLPQSLTESSQPSLALTSAPVPVPVASEVVTVSKVVQNWNKKQEPRRRRKSHQKEEALRNLPSEEEKQDKLKKEVIENHYESGFDYLLGRNGKQKHLKNAIVSFKEAAKNEAMLPNLTVWNSFLKKDEFGRSLLDHNARSALANLFGEIAIDLQYSKIVRDHYTASLSQLMASPSQPRSLPCAQGAVESTQPLSNYQLWDGSIFFGDFFETFIKRRIRDRSWRKVLLGKKSSL